MRSYIWAVSFAVLAGVFCMIVEGCGDDSSYLVPEGGAQDGARGDATMMAEGGAADAPNDTTNEAAPCVDASINVASFDSGSAAWACFQAGCPVELNACAADCTCNAVLATGLLCAADAADTVAQQMCVDNQLTSLGDAGASLLACLGGQLASCLTGSAGDAGAEGGDGSLGDGGDAQSDAGSTDGGDAATE